MKRFLIAFFLIFTILIAADGVLCAKAGAGEGPEGSSGKDETAELSREPSLSAETQEDGCAYGQGYAYGQLSEEEKGLYLELLWAVTGFQEQTPLSVWDMETIEKVFACMMADHAEIFYVDGYTCTERRLGEELQEVVFGASYTMDREQAARCQVQIEEAASRYLSLLSDEMDDYEKLKTLYDELIRSTQYQQDAPENQNICSVFLYGRSVCQGYAKAFQYLAGQAGIPAVLATGTASGRPHAWTVVCCNGNWYHVDPTWGDVSYQLAEGGTAADASSDFGWLPEEISYEYFLTDDSWLLPTHAADTPFALPSCDSLADNYYVRNGTYFTGLDPEQIEEAFTKAYAAEERQLTLKCADEDTFEALTGFLITDQGIFDYLRDPSSSVAYSLSSVQRTLTFWY